MTRVNNGDAIEGPSLLQTDPLLVTHVYPLEPDFVSYHVEGFEGTKRSYRYLMRHEVALKNKTS